MQESGWLKGALESAVQETTAVGDKIGLARLAILERLVSPASASREEEDALFDALDQLRALDLERLSASREMVAA